MKKITWCLSVWDWPNIHNLIISTCIHIVVRHTFILLYSWESLIVWLCTTFSPDILLMYTSGVSYLPHYYCYCCYQILDQNLNEKQFDQSQEVETAKTLPDYKNSRTSLKDPLPLAQLCLLSFTTLQRNITRKKPVL